MIKFLLERPIAVLMSFTACFIIGLVTYFGLPVSLLPDISIPEITIQVSGKNTSARELENTMVKPIRQQLMQVGKIKNIQSETRDGAGIIRLSFDFGTNTDLAFIEVNEKIDAAMSLLPRDAERPRVIKASATDIPVFYLNLTLKKDSAYKDLNEKEFLDLSEFAESVIKRRIEQLPEIAMVDVTGTLDKQLQIVPDMDKSSMLDITIQDIENALSDNNIEPGSMAVKDGHYEYNIKFSTLLRTLEDVQNIYIRKNGRIFQLKEFCRINIIPRKVNGLSISEGKRAVTLAIIKQADENMENMKEALNNTTSYFAHVYPDIDFKITRNQTELLDYTISNLKQNLSLGFIFICVVAILFLGDIKSPFIIGISMVVALMGSFIFFYLFGMSLNIISLSGLILALGMMIDSSIIVTENISQYKEKGLTLKRACAKGTSEVMTPMLSSSLTTIAVFLPLIFMSGIAGAIFYDQAFAVTVGLMASYFTGIMLLPVLYMLIYRINFNKRNIFSFNINNPIKAHTLDTFYDKGVDFVFKHKAGSILFCAISLPICIFFFFFIKKERMPQIDQNELIVNIEWNENIHLDENQRRINNIFRSTEAKAIEHAAYIGQQDYLLNRGHELSTSEAELYYKTNDSEDISFLEKSLNKEITKQYPSAVVSFSPPETFFEKLFKTGEADVIAELYSKNKTIIPEANSIKDIRKSLMEKTKERIAPIPFEKQLNIYIDHEKLLLYNVDYNEVYRILKTSFKENNVATLRSYQQYLPINISGNEKSINEMLRETLVPTQPTGNEETNYIPIQSLISITPSEDLKSIIAGKNGEYIPFSFHQPKDPEALIKQVKEKVQTSDKWETEFSGSFFSNKEMMDELVIILFISILLMYFILAAQFESFLQPFLVLVEIPIDIAFALLVLWMFGYTLNLMSAIGLIVTAGIVINDSILKLDAINELRKEGVPLIEAIHEAGRRRLRPIIMTSLTTIFAMVPLLFSFDMGSELQKPLSVAMIATMTIGTLVSLFIIPLLYWVIYRNKKVTKNTLP